MGGGGKNKRKEEGEEGIEEYVVVERNEKEQE